MALPVPRATRARALSKLVFFNTTIRHGKPPPLSPRACRLCLVAVRVRNGLVCRAVRAAARSAAAPAGWQCHASCQVRLQAAQSSLDVV